MTTTDELITCLLCGKLMRAMGSHLSRAHNMTPRQYRAQFDLPASYRLASAKLRSEQADRTKQAIAAGAMHNDPRAASDAARNAGRGKKCTADREKQAEIARNLPRQQLPPGAKRADGRDADKARAAQQRRRAAKLND